MNASAPPPLTPAEAREFIQHRTEEAGSGAIGITQHARERARERNIGRRDLEHVLKNGTVDEPVWDERYGNWKYRVSGTDVDGEDLTVIVALDPALERITIVTGI